MKIKEKIIEATDNSELKPLNENQKWYYKKIMKLGRDKKVKAISYDELFAVLDRVKFCYFLSYLKDENKINLIRENKVACKDCIKAYKLNGRFIRKT